MNHHDTDIVNALRLAIAEGVGQDRFELWFRGAQITLEGSTVRIATGTSFTLGRMRTSMRSEIESACQAVLGCDARVEFHLTPLVAVESAAVAEEQSTSNTSAGDISGTSTDASADRAAAAPSLAAGVDAEGATPRPHGSSRKKFAKLETFVSGSMNQVAIAAAEMVAGNLGSVSPLFLYGATGIGKSHLAQGIWSRVRRRSNGPRCVYLTAEQFTTYFLQALNGSGMPSFRRRYRKVDLLVIEDIQFLAGKRTTIVELQHTIDEVAQEGGQIVLTADGSPAELSGLGSELATRLTGGLVVRVEAPDEGARRQIIEDAARQRGLQLPATVVASIAERLVGDVRKLLGAVNRLHAACLAWNCPVVHEALAAKALEDLFRGNVRSVGLAEVEQAVCSVFEVTTTHLRSASKSRKHSQPRMLAMWLARKYTRVGLSEIGDHFGSRSHATVISATKKVAQWMDADARIRLMDQDCAVLDAVRRVEQRLLG